MDNCQEDLRRQLNTCRNIISKGHTTIQNTRLTWLNTFCLEFLKFSQHLHTFLSQWREKQKYEKSEHVETIYLCLTQIVTCIKYMETTIKIEEEQNKAISSSRQHFLDRIHWCLDRLRSCLQFLTENEVKKVKLPEERSFVELMDRVLDLLSLYSSYKEESEDNIKEKSTNIAENLAEALFDSKEIRSIVDLILGHTLGFANVALQQDKKALSALCQKVLHECMAFQEECADGMLPGARLNDSNRKLKATSLENALYRLEDYINEALLRLVYNSFLDFNKLSIEKLRQFILQRGTDDSELDDLIADFDVNVDRTTQIGLFAIAFAPNMKIKTIVRSCLASLESLDYCIIPSLQTRGTSDIFAKILEQHFNEEVSIFKNSIQEIIDSQAFASCYFELLTQTIKHNGIAYSKQSLEDINEMGALLYEHFRLPVNYQQLRFDENADRLELLKKFHLILQECQSVVKCDTLQSEPQRVLKRFKVLRSILRKLIDEIGDKTANDFGDNSQVFLMSDNVKDSQQMFSSLAITPSTKSILYNSTTTKESRRNHRVLNESLKAMYSQLPTTPTPKTTTVLNSENNIIRMPKTQTQRSSLRRKESLRTALFKRQKTGETDKMYNVYKNNSNSLQISEILDQLTDLSLNLSNQTVDKNIISG